MATPLFTVELKGDRELIAQLSTGADALMRAVKRKVQQLALELQRKVQKEYLSGPTGDHTLSVRTGALRRSVFQKVETTEGGAIATVGYSGDVPYAAIHEFGGQINIPAKAQALSFVTSGKATFAKHIAAHTIVIPERAPLRTAFADMEGRIVSELKKVIEESKLL